MDVSTNRETRELQVEGVFNAPRALVFKAWSDCESVSQWWGPRQWPVSFCEMDFRVGGDWRYAMKGPDGTESWGKASYKTIDPPSRIVMSDVFTDKDGNVSTEMPQMTMSIDFAEQDGGTKITMRTQFASADDLDEVLKMGMVEGLTEAWDQLEELLAKA